MAGNLIITLNRQYGSGGKEMGTKLANLLGIKLYDSEILKMAADKSGIRKDYFGNEYIFNGKFYESAGQHIIKRPPF